MKRSWIAALAVGVTFASALIAACGTSADNGDLCTDEGGFCTAASACGSVLPFGCGTSSNVCCAPGAASPSLSAGGAGTATPAPTPAPTSTATTPEDSGSTVVTPMDSGTVESMDTGTVETMDSGNDTGTIRDSESDTKG